MAFWDNRITGNRADHAKYGVGPATDYGADIGDPIHAPFAGRVSTYDTVDGGYGLKITAPDGTYAIMQHLNKRVTPRDVAHREVIAEAGNTGLSKGPHVHAWVMYRGERIAFQEWLDWHVRGKSATPPANAQVHQPQVKLDVSWYVYPTEHDAYWARENGGQRNLGTVPPGTYTIVDFGNNGEPVAINAPGQAGRRNAGKVWVGAKGLPAPRVN